MNNKKILIVLSVIALTLLFIGAVSAADNTTTDTVKIKENNNEKTISESRIQSTNNNAISNIKKEDESKVNSIQTEHTNKQYKHKVLINAPAKNFKYKSNSHFKISLKDSDTYDPIKNKKVKIKISFGKASKSKYYTTNSQGLISLNTKNLKIGVYKVTINIPRSKDTYATSKNTKIVISKYIPTSIIVPLKDASVPWEYIPMYRLKTGQKLDAFYNTELYGMYPNGIYIGTMLNPGQGEYSNTKLLKAQIYFKSQSTGKIISKIYTKTNHNHDNMKVIKLIKGYTPIKANVWYKHK